ncbi:MAG TPA: hypothetical protein VH370_15435 [Humisphaera sp.]|jgi:hypothetical protein|nr:hypothetical protein [Humisphaera sp.]
MKQRERRIIRLNEVFREYQAAQVAVRMLAAELRRDPSFLNAFNLQAADFKRLKTNTEATYLVRMQAEFEGGLRSIWVSTIRDTYPPMSVLLQSLSARRSIPVQVTENADRARKFRNAIVHEDSGRAGAVSMQDAARWLALYFSYMPANW